MGIRITAIMFEIEIERKRESKKNVDATVSQGVVGIGEWMIGVSSMLCVGQGCGGRGWESSMMVLFFLFFFFNSNFR